MSCMEEIVTIVMESRRKGRKIRPLRRKNLIPSISIPLVSMEQQIIMRRNQKTKAQEI